MRARHELKAAVTETPEWGNQTSEMITAIASDGVNFHVFKVALFVKLFAAFRDLADTNALGDARSH
ncbi:hypothetical protein HDU90_003608 [Geranomyces variabilis]|nr:hypothetical protein HDU90_003608 [Geranomyces variabilis]